MRLVKRALRQINNDRKIELNFDDFKEFSF